MKGTLWIAVFLLLLATSLFFTYWTQTQPVWIVRRGVESSVHSEIPLKNRQIIAFLEKNGATLAPDYDQVVCTEFVVSAITPFVSLTQHEKNNIRIITTEELIPLIETENHLIKGVQTALTSSNKGTEIANASDVLPGDFVQFWNVYGNKAYGHCGIILDVEPGQSLTLYSSHPLTGGYGKQVFLWPDKVFFVRLN